MRVTAGRDSGSTMEVLGGLAPGQSVIANPPDSLTDGELVRVVTPTCGEQSMKAFRTIALLAPLTLAGCALLLAGCKTVGPNYKAPPVPAPPSFSDDGHNGDWASAKPADAADRGTWWAIYQNPELNDLGTRCASANQNIAASLHAYQQAHDLVRESHASLYPTVSLGGSATRNASPPTLRR